MRKHVKIRTWNMNSESFVPTLLVFMFQQEVHDVKIENGDVYILYRTELSLTTPEWKTGARQDKIFTVEKTWSLKPCIHNLTYFNFGFSFTIYVNFNASETIFFFLSIRVLVKYKVMCLVGRERLDLTTQSLLTSVTLKSFKFVVV